VGAENIMCETTLEVFRQHRSISHDEGIGTLQNIKITSTLFNVE
jgi:hypothetical protein